MAEALADIRSRALQQEAELLEVMQAAAGLVAPPFPPKLRMAINRGFGPVHTLQAQLNDTWIRQLHAPETRDLPHYSQDRLYFGALRRRLNLWIECHTLMQRMMVARPLPLWPEAPAGASAVGRQLYAYQGAFYRLHDYLSPPRPNPEDWVGRHNDIPLQFTLFAQLMQLARRTALALNRQAPMTFLDVGCGVGLKVLQAAEFFEVAQGLEYDATRVVVADRLIQHPRRVKDGVFEGDALAYDGYGGFEVIYAYKPVSFEELLIRMEKRIVAQARPGTVLVMPYVEFAGRYESYGLGRVADMVYVTGYGNRDMKPLLQRIARIGFIVPDDPALRNFDEGFVAPLANALRRWGHLA